MQKKVIIIGSGIAGLASSIRLAVAGFDVEVYESNSYPGGKLTSFSKDGFHFDAGPSLFTQPLNVVELFTLCSEDHEKYFKYRKVDNTCTYFFEDGNVINAYSDADLFHEELNNVADEKGDVKKYLNDSAVLYNKIGKIFLNYSLHKKNTWLHRRVLSAVTHLKFPYLFKTLDHFNSKKFTSSKTTRIFNRFATYNGSDPYRAPAMLSLIPHLEYNEGIYYPEGGMISITESLYQLALRQGVKFNFNSAVERIIHSEGRVHGIVANGKNISADIVISNSDVYFTYMNLLNLDSKARKILRQERSSSALIFYWGISKKFPQLQLHNIFFSEHYSEEFKYLFQKKQTFSDHTVYINITSKPDHSHAPENMENWFVMINVPSNEGQNWSAITEKARMNIIKKLSRMLGEDIEPLIISETVLDPVLIEERTGSYKGSLYGSSSNSKLSAFVRHPNFSKNIKDLYFCGGSVHPGGGIPLCLKSAAIVTDLIMAYQNKKH